MPDQPDLEALLAAEQREQATLNEALVVRKAERAVTNLRQQELSAEHEALYQHLTTAEAALTSAQQDGSTAAIAAARQDYEAAYAEFNRRGRTLLVEMQTLLDAQLAGGQELFAQMDQASTARAAVDAARPRSWRPPGTTSEPDAGAAGGVR